MNVQLFIKRNASTILTGVGVAGVVTTTITAVKATPKALQLLEQAKAEKGEDLTKLEMVKAAGIAYVPTAIIGVSTITCIVGANVLNKKHQAALTSAYALLNSSYKEYKKKVEDLYGAEVDTHIKQEIAKDKYENVETPEDDGKELFYDEFSGRYFRSTMADVQQAEYRLNRDNTMRGYVYLNEFYEHLDLEPIESGNTLGWSPGACLDYYWQEWIDFSHSKVVMDDGLECNVIYMLEEPIPDFADYC